MSWIVIKLLFSISIIHHLFIYQMHFETSKLRAAFSCLHVANMICCRVKELANNISAKTQWNIFPVSWQTTPAIVSEDCIFLNFTLLLLLIFDITFCKFYPLPSFLPTWKQENENIKVLSMINVSLSFRLVIICPLH